MDRKASGRTLIAILGLFFLVAVFGCSRLHVDGWVTESGNVFSASFTSAPATPLKLALDLGAVGSIDDATIEARVENTGTTSIAYGGVIQEGGAISLCPCQSGPLNLGALGPGDCLRIKTKPVKTAGGTESVAFRLDGFIDIAISATLPAGTAPSSGGLTISSNCD